MIGILLGFTRDVFKLLFLLYIFFLVNNISTSISEKFF